jgi:hypothetical protein
MDDVSNDNLRSITNELILKYDKRFDELYDKIVHLNSSIMNKEEIIIKENEDIKLKNNSIEVLQISILFILVFSCLLIAYSVKRIKILQLIVCTIILIFIYLIVISYFVIYRVETRKLLKKFDKLGSNMHKYIDQTIINKLDLKCPVKCKPNPTPVNPGNINGYESPTLRTDPQVNVWQYGDIPTDLYTTDKLPASTFYVNANGIPIYTATKEEEKYNEPKPFFKSNYPRSTYYECKWLGGDGNNGGLPNMEKNKYSSIPCDYRPNFAMLNRYVCTKNPNNLSKEVFNNVCSKVSEKTNILDSL